jgi:hypothetical protein
MLTYRTGAAGAPSAARFMSEHLLQQTLPPEMAAMAEYYEQGVTPPTPADAAASRYGHLISAGNQFIGVQLEGLLEIEVLRLRESALHSDGSEIAPEELFLRAVGAFLAASLIGRPEALVSLQAGGIAFDSQRLDAAVADAARDRDYSSAAAAPRRDMHPSLAQRLGIDARRGLTQSEVAFLLNGQRADGGEIAGRTKRATTLSIGNIFQLDHRRKPTPIQLARVLAGQTGEGQALPPEDAAKAVRRFLVVMGVKSVAPTPAETENILGGRMADGREMTNAQFQSAMDTSKARIGYIDFTFSAPKSVSIAWAFAPTKSADARHVRTRQVFFLGVVSSHSLNDVAGTRQRFAVPSQRRQCGLLVLRTLVIGVAPNCGGAGIPQRIIVSSRPPSTVLRTTGAIASGKMAGIDGKSPAVSSAARIQGSIKWYSPMPGINLSNYW